MKRIGRVLVLQVSGVPGCRHQFGAQPSPVGAQQHALPEPGVRQVEGEKPVDVVASDGSVDDILVERVCRRVREDRVEIRPDVSERTDRRLEVFQVLDQIGARVVDQPGGGVAEHAQLVQGGDDAGALADQHIQRRRYLAQRFGDDVALSGQRAGQPVQSLYRGDEAAALLVEGAHELVEALKQVAHSALMPGQRGVEVVDDVADLSQSSGVEDDGQRRQCLLGRWIGRRLVERDGRARFESSTARLAGRRIEFQMHRSQQAGLADTGHHVGGHDDITLYRDLNVGVPGFHRHFADAAHHDVVDQHRRIRFHRTDIRDLDVEDVRARSASDRPGQG